MGYKIEELKGKHFTQLVSPEYREKVLKFYEDQLKREQPTSYLEFPVDTKSVEQIWLGQRVRFQFGTNKKTMVTAISRHICELRRAQKAIEDSAEKYRGIIEGMQLGIMEVDFDGKVKKVYGRFCEITGYEAEELIGKDPNKILVEPQDEPFMEQQEKQRH